MDNKIKAKITDIVVQDLNNEVLIYDLSKNKAFCLNETASLIWKLCNGEKTVTEISQKMSETLKSPVPDDLVWLAIEQFDKDNLLENGLTFKARFEGVSRREVIKKIGLASMIALPVISSVVAPTALHAQSGGCVENGQDFCISPQANVQSCIDAIFPLEMTACCGGIFQVVTFDNPLGSNSCCGTCNPRIG